MMLTMCISWFIAMPPVDGLSVHFAAVGQFLWKLDMQQTKLLDILSESSPSSLPTDQGTINRL